MKAGLNIFSIRNLLETEESFLCAAKQLKEMGYSYLQYSGMPFDAQKAKRVSEETGMPFVLTHVPMDRILNDTDALVWEHLSFGCRNIGLGAMPIADIMNKEKCYETIAALDRAGARMEELGCRFFYHHHYFEFYRHDGVTVFDYILENAPHINFTLDTYWLQYGGVDICDTIDRLNGRIACVHLKDYMIAQKPVKEGVKPGFEPRFAPVGDGTINMKAAVEHAKAAGAEYFLVEQDNASKLPDTLGQVERSIRYINQYL
ncbi:MAG: sugar phosphate isomerase/epimerase [Clostridia bacterium]|nr:sugar phosphate isomerase/epimerase [Clostridia bacterium]